MSLQVESSQESVKEPSDPLSVIYFKKQGFNPTYIKIDPYLNVDAGTMNPYEHGEVFVLQDGTECDLDLGCYERFLDITLTKHHNITTGKIYKTIIEQERNGKYLGKTVQIIPHVTDYIQECIQTASELIVSENNQKSNICIIELGGTINDIETQPFIEALRQFSLKNTCTFCHVSYIPFIHATNCHKTKPTQESIISLRSKGIIPNLLFCRSHQPIETNLVDKISIMCGIPIPNIFNVHDANPLEIPNILFQQNVTSALHLNSYTSPLGFPLMLNPTFAKHIKPIAIIGKYTEDQDSYLSIKYAIIHALKKLELYTTIIYSTGEQFESEFSNYSCVIIAPGFGQRGLETKINVARLCRTHNIPVLGICFGYQAMLLEYARHIANLPHATTEEINPVSDFNLIQQLQTITSQKLGGTMRLGSHTIKLYPGSKIHQLYQKENISERHRHRFGILETSKYTSVLIQYNLHFTGISPNGELEVLEIASHPFYIGVQYHPEFQSRPDNPSPLFIGLLQSIIS